MKSKPLTEVRSTRVKDKSKPKFKRDLKKLKTKIKSVDRAVYAYTSIENWHAFATKDEYWGVKNIKKKRRIFSVSKENIQIDINQMPVQS